MTCKSDLQPQASAGFEVYCAFTTRNRVYNAPYLSLLLITTDSLSAFRYKEALATGPETLEIRHDFGSRILWPDRVKHVV